MSPPQLSNRTAHGSALLVVMLTISVIATLIGAALNYTSTTARIGNRSRDMISAQALGEGALELAFKRWQTYMIRTGGSTIPSASDLAGTAIINAPNIVSRINALPNHAGFTLRSLVVVPVDRQDNLVVDATSPLSATRLQQIASRVAVPGQPGWSGCSYSFRATAVVSSDNILEQGMPLQVTVSRYFQKVQSSLFQSMLFFQDDLELHPGAQMGVHGLVHTNSNLYAAASSDASLTFSGNVSYTGHPSTLSAASGDTVDTRGYVEGITDTLAKQESNSWKTFNAPQYATAKSNQLSQVASLDPLGTSAGASVPAAQQNDNTSGLHEIIERPAPNQTDPPAYAEHRLYAYAGLRITINRADKKQPIHVYTPDTSDPSWSSPDPHANASTEIVPAYISNQNLLKILFPSPPNIADRIIAAISVSNGNAAPIAAGGSSGKGDIFDFRESREVNLNTIDVSKLTPALNAYSDYNGIIYISDITHADANLESSTVDAIRLKKGGVLPNQGMTVISDGAVYLQGDFNTGTTYGSDLLSGLINLLLQPVSNLLGSDPAQSTTPAYTQKPSAIMGDAVMILSNAWCDDNGHLDLSYRNASSTTINTAILSGQVLTDAASGKTSGGAHNFPRFLENWKGDTLTYHGSMCQLFASKHWTGDYGSANVYNPPNRQWYFDDAFLVTPPNGSVTSTTYSRGRWTTY